MLAAVHAPSDAPPPPTQQQHDVPLLACVPAPPGTTRLHFSWALGPRLLLTPVGGGQARQAGEPLAGSVVQWSALSALERRLVYDTLPMIEDLHAALAQGECASARPDWPDTVRAYAAAVSAQMAPPPVEGEDDAVAAARAEHAAWDWAGLLFLGGRGGPLGEDVAAWYRAHAAALCVADDEGSGPPPLAASLARLVDLSTPPEADPAYWPTAARLAAVGWADEAVALLGAHSAWDEAGSSGGGAGGPVPPAAAAALAALEPVGLALRSQPRLLPSSGIVAGGGPGDVPATSTAHTSPSAFAQARAAWLAGVRRCAADEGLWAAAAAGDPATAAGARALLRVLGGEPAAVDAAALGLLAGADDRVPPVAAGSWPDVLVARCLHAGDARTVPASPADLATAAAAAAATAAACPASPPLTPAASARDAMLLGVADAAAAGEPARAAAALSAGCSSWAMAALTPLLYAHHAAATGRAGEPLPHFGGTSGEWWALDLAAGLAGSAVTRPAAARLLGAACPVHGAGGAAALFARAPCPADAAGAGDDGPAARAAASAARVGSAAGEAAVARAAGVAHWHAGRPGAALAWLARAGDGGRAAVVGGRVADAARAGLGVGGDGDALAGSGGAATVVSDVAGPLAELAAAGAAGGCGPLAALGQLEAAVAAGAAAPGGPARLAAAVLATAAAGPPAAVPAALFRAIPALEAPPGRGGAVAAVPAATVEAMVALLDEAAAAIGGAATTQPAAEAGKAAAVEGAVRLALARALARAYVAG